MSNERKAIWKAIELGQGKRLEQIAAERIRLTSEVVVNGRRLPGSEMDEKLREIDRLDAERDAILEAVS